MGLGSWSYRISQLIILIGGENMPLPHEHRNHEHPKHELAPHEEIIELIERKFRELNDRLDEIESRLEK